MVCQSKNLVCQSENLVCQPVSVKKPEKLSNQQVISTICSMNIGIVNTNYILITISYSTLVPVVHTPMLSWLAITHKATKRLMCLFLTSTRDLVCHCAYINLSTGRCYSWHSNKSLPRISVTLNIAKLFHLIATNFFYREFQSSFSTYSS